MDMLQLILWHILFLQVIAATGGGQNKNTLALNYRLKLLSEQNEIKNNFSSSSQLKLSIGWPSG